MVRLLSFGWVVLLAFALPLLAQGPSLRPGWGSTPYADASGTGVTFRVWAPQAGSVSVAGTFNGWSSAAHALVREGVASGAWSLDVAAARTNDSYKYVIDGSLWRSDPRSRIIHSADNQNSVITRTNDFNWTGDSAVITNAADLVIYEAHVGTFMGPGGTFSSFTNRLDYLRDLGVSALELMPVNEFPSATSWGYNPAYPFALESGYGTPHAFKTLVQGAHQRGLVTLLDVVHNHWDGNSSLWQLDGSTPGPYFYASDPYALTPWGPRPDFGRAEVRDYIEDTFRMWVDEYHISGFRWDAPRHIIYTTNDLFIADGLTMVTNALNLMATRYPGTWNIAEDTKDIAGFNYFWDFTFNWEIKGVLTQADDAQRDMPTVARNVGGSPGRILYTESHDTAGDLNNGVRLPTAIHGADPAGYYARKRSALGAVLVMTSPGTPMILQGQELLETNSFSDGRAMEWARTNTQSGTLRLYRDLIRLRRNLDGVSAGLLGDATSTYQVDNQNKLVAYSRGDSANTGGAVVVVAHFANTTRTGFTVQFPSAGTWYTLFNSDSTNYASDYGNFGSATVTAAGNPPTAPVNLGPYSALIFSRIPRSGLLVLAQDLVDQPAGNGDGLLDPGETLRARLVLWNKSQVVASNVTAYLTSDTPGITVQQGLSPYPAMAPEATATNSIWFELQIASTQSCGSLARLQLVTAFNDQYVTSLLEQVVGQEIQLQPATNLFLSADVPKPIADNNTTYSTLTINEPGGNTLSEVQVRVRLQHTYDRDLTLALQHPDGSEVILVSRRGGSGDHFGTGSGACGTMTYTVFDQSAATLIRNGSAPFAGTYRPEGSLSTFQGKPLNGTWRLRMRDGFSSNTGTALCWGLRATYEQRAFVCHDFTNHPPVAHGATVGLAPPGPALFALGGDDEDGQPLTFATRTEPAHGLFQLLSATTGQAVYTPVHGYTGTDAVVFVVSDGIATSASATVTLQVQPPADLNANGLPDAWEEAYFTNLFTALPDADDDGDGMPNRDEYLAHTHPRESNSVLRLTGQQLGPAGYALTWSSVGGTRYGVECSSLDLASTGAVFQSLPRPLAQEMDLAPYGTTSTMTFSESLAPTNRARTYRLRVLND